MLWVASICVNMKAHNRNPAGNLRILIIEIAIKVFESATPPPKNSGNARIEVAVKNILQYLL